MLFLKIPLGIFWKKSGEEKSRIAEYTWHKNSAPFQIFFREGTTNQPHIQTQKAVLSIADLTISTRPPNSVARLCKMQYGANSQKGLTTTQRISRKLYPVQNTCILHYSPYDHRAKKIAEVIWPIIEGKPSEKASPKTSSPRIPIIYTRQLCLKMSQTSPISLQPDINRRMTSGPKLMSPEIYPDVIRFRA